MRDKIITPRLLLIAAWFGVLHWPTTGFAVTPMQSYVAAMQPGTNLGNTYDAIPNETAWGNPIVTREFIQQVAAQGFRSIRIPVTWTDHVGAAPQYTVDSAWLDRVQQVVDWSLDAGLYVMINMHHDSWQWVAAMPENHDAVLAKYTAIWTQVAHRFRDHSSQLMFESINEPDFDSGTEAARMALLDELNSAFFQIVRTSGGGNATRPLVLPSLATNAAQVRLDSLMNTMNKLNDSNLIATIHFYGYWPFSVNIEGVTKFDAATQNDITTSLTAAHDTFVNRGIPVVIGEYGLLAFDGTSTVIEHGEAMKYFESFTAGVRERGLTHMLWDAGNLFGRTTAEWRDPQLYAIISRSVTGRSSTAETDLIFLKDGSMTSDVTIALNPNGGAFASLTDGSAPLTAGRDYVLSGNTLTVKADTLTRHATGPDGETAVLNANFDAGPAWPIHVRLYHQATHGKSTGTTANGVVIPTAFNGDLISTMEAVYDTGGYAGPENWTAFKQYGVSFSPNYNAGNITLLPKFFEGAKAGTINLTFHYWSGETTKYQVTVTGSSVGGDLPGTAPAPTPVPVTPPPTPSTNPSSSGGGGGGGGALSPAFVLALGLGWLIRRRTVRTARAA